MTSDDHDKKLQESDFDDLDLELDDDDEDDSDFALDDNGDLDAVLDDEKEGTSDEPAETSVKKDEEVLEPEISPPSDTSLTATPPGKPAEMGSREDPSLSGLQAYVRETEPTEPEEVHETIPEEDEKDVSSRLQDEMEGFPGAEEALGSEDNFEDEEDFDETMDEYLEQTLDTPKKSNIFKYAAPALVILLASGGAGYIVMNPDILGGQNSSNVSMPVAAKPALAPLEPSGQNIHANAPQPVPAPNVESPRAPEPSVISVDMAEFEEEMPPAPSLPMPDEQEVLAEDEMSFSVSFNDDVPDEPILPEKQEVVEMPEAMEATEEMSVMEGPISEQGLMDQAEAAIEEIVEEAHAEIVEQVDSEDGLAAIEEAPPPVNALEAVSSETPEMEVTPEQAIEDSSAAIEPPQDVMPPVPEDMEVSPAPMEENTIGETVPEVVDQGEITIPDAALLESAEDKTAEPVVGEARAPVHRAMAETEPKAQPTQEDVFYDAGVTVASPYDNSPKKVDPRAEPGQQYVVVKKAANETDQEALLVSANRALQLKRYEAALEMFNNLYKKNNRDIRILIGRAVALQATGQDEAAIAMYDAVLDISPENAQALVNMLGLLRKQYPSVALRRLLDLYDKHSGNAGVAAQVALTQAELGYYDEAVRYMQIASSLEPENAQHVYNLAIIYDRLGKKDKAIEYYQQALETDAIYGGGKSVPRERIYDRLSILRRY